VPRKAACFLQGGFVERKIFNNYRQPPLGWPVARAQIFLVEWHSPVIKKSPAPWPVIETAKRPGRSLNIKAVKAAIDLLA